MHKRWTARYATAVVVLIVLTATPSSSAFATPVSVSGDSEDLGAAAAADFNADWVVDLAVGVPLEALGTTTEAGAVHALYGTKTSGITYAGSEFWTQGVTGTEGAAEAYDHFGFALAVGDFDCYGGYDLAVGVPGQAVDDLPNAGAVHILYGFSGVGLETTWDQVFHQNTGAVGSLAESGDAFGWTLAAGDFDGDGCDDLAVGVPFETWNLQYAGIVQILYGSGAGLLDARTQLWRQGADGLPEAEGVNDYFGRALAAGNFNGDGLDDLAIGVPGEDFEDTTTRYDVGVVHVLYGSGTGLTAAGDQLWYEDLTGLLDDSEHQDQFGWSLTAGDFDGNGLDELAIGVPGERVADDALAGAVHILQGHSFGLIAVGDQIFTQDSLGLVSENGDRFGWALTASDFNGDGREDLAVGAPWEDFGFDDIGCVNVVFGSSTGLTPVGRSEFYQGTPSFLADVPELNDRFGTALASGDFNADGFGDLAIGVPFEDVVFDSANRVDAGAIHILYGMRLGLDNANDAFWTQASPGITGDPEAGDTFGFALAALPMVVRSVYLPLTLK